MLDITYKIHGGDMLKYSELMGNHVITEIPLSHQQNGETLLKRINIVREKYGKPMTVTSGYRSLQDHLRVYSELAHKRGVPFDPNKVPMGSAHLSFSACDILDLDGSLFNWCKDNLDTLEEAQLWLEEKDDQPRVHFQIYPPKSGKRFFNP
jgi:hypothetical protein